MTLIFLTALSITTQGSVLAPAHIFSFDFGMVKLIVVAVTYHAVLYGALQLSLSSPVVRARSRAKIGLSALRSSLTAWQTWKRASRSLGNLSF